MRTNPKQPRAGLSDWRVETLRATLFVLSDDDPETRLRELTPDDLDVQMDARMGPARQRTFHYRGGQLNLATQPGVINWTWSHIDQDSSEAGNTPYPEFAAPFHDLMRNWLATRSGLVRLAYGPALRLAVPSREAGYSRLSDYLCFDLDEDSFDFSYQINRPRFIEEPIQIKVNRLSRWSVASRYRMLPMQRPRRISSFARVEMDINTDAESADELAPGQAQAIFDTLLAFADEITLDGDVS